VSSTESRTIFGELKTNPTRSETSSTRFRTSWFRFDQSFSESKQSSSDSDHSHSGPVASFCRHVLSIACRRTAIARAVAGSFVSPIPSTSVFETKTRVEKGRRRAFSEEDVGIGRRGAAASRCGR
jgi:hypothetical protein